MNAAAYQTRTATVWDLLAVGDAFTSAGFVTSDWHTGPTAGRVTTWKTAQQWNEETRVWEVALSAPTDGADETMILDLDYYETPDKGERHLVHADLRGVTLRHPDGTPRATYRIPDDIYFQMTPDEMYAHDHRTSEAIAIALADLGFASEADERMAGSFHVNITGGGSAETGYWVVGSSINPKGWKLLPMHKDHHYGDYNLDNEGLVNLNLPLDTPVDVVAAAAADWLAANAPGLRTSP